MADIGNFDATQVDPATGFDPLPAGDYPVIIIDSGMKSTKNGAGRYLELTMQVIDGQFANRLIWDRLILEHTNAKTVEIAERQLSAICHAVGVLQVQDSTQLHDRPFTVRVKFVSDPQYGGKNEVSSYKAIAATATSQQQVPAQPPAMPWQQQQPQQPQPQASAPQSSAPEPEAQAAAPPWAKYWSNQSRST